MTRWLLPTMLLACSPPPVACPDASVGEGPRKLAIATATDTSFDDGTLTLVDLDGLEVCDDLLTLTGDTVLDVVGGQLVALDRRGHDRLRSWVPGEWDRPATEFSTGQGSNPHSAVPCGGYTVVSLYGETGEAALGVFDDKGRRRASVDLSDFADADGKPEVSDLVGDGEHVWAGAQRLDRGREWASAGPGALVQVDCDTWTASDSWDTPPNPRVSGDPRDRLLIGGEDGALASWTAGEGIVALPPVDGEVTSAALGPGGRGLIVTDAELWYTIHCLVDGETTPLVTTDAYVSAAVVDEDGLGWVAVRGGWSDPEDAPEGARISPAPGVWRVDLDQCEIIDEIATALPPFDLATY